MFLYCSFRLSHLDLERLFLILICRASEVFLQKARNSIMLVDVELVFRIELSGELGLLLLHLF